MSDVIDFLEAKKTISLEVQERDRFSYNMNTGRRFGFSEKCYCRKFIIDKNSYTIECKDCGKTYNAFALLEHYAKEEKIYRDLLLNCITFCEGIIDKLDLQDNGYIKLVKNEEKRKVLEKMHRTLKFLYKKNNCCLKMQKQWSENG